MGHLASTDQRKHKLAALSRYPSPTYIRKGVGEVDKALNAPAKLDRPHGDGKSSDLQRKPLQKTQGPLCYGERLCGLLPCSPTTTLRQGYKEGMMVENVK
ncbi:unnamed protein product [Pleuronectes platessa]|uniref:Uncharacterized protein n=1 Tax=Pleuronectes platessa TaxID=8262 RepID=A0A9N7YQ35_PLEPL|nr:unnamed protein product [Pleuronectes platessa]